MVPLSPEPVLVRDALPGEPPRRLRTSADPLPSLGPEPSPAELRLGLRELRASASGQLTEEGLQKLRAQVLGAGPLDPREPPRLWIFDLRQEAHGFIDGLPISFYAPRNWGNLGRSREGALQEEARRLAALQEEVRHRGAVRFPGHTKDVRAKAREVTESGPLDSLEIIPVRRSVRSEREVVEGLSLGYVRLLVTDHQGASEEELLRFEAAVRALPPGAWVHFHCRGGKGRASTFLLLYDILRNARRPQGRTGLSTLLLRQRLLSGYAVDEVSASSDWKRPYQEERLLQVRACYDRWSTAQRSG